MPPRSILLIDDDEFLRQSLAEQLVVEGFAPVQAATAAEGQRLAGAQAFDLMVLDVGLPDRDGRDLCKALRDAGVRVPIIMLTAAAAEADTIRALDQGANDYVTKPFRLGVLLARIRAHIRSHEQSDEASFSIGPYQFQPAARMLVDGLKKVKLTDKEAAILKYLYRAGSRVISRDTLLGEVWGYNAGVSTHTLETHVYRLRQKIEADPANARILVTEPGGYKLVP